MKIIQPLNVYYFIPKHNCFQKETPLHVLTCFLILSWNFYSCDPGLAQEVVLISNDSTYLSDIFPKFNELNLSLQGNKRNLSKVKSALSGFNNKLTLYQQNLAGRDFFSSQACKLDSRSGNAISQGRQPTAPNKIIRLAAFLQILVVIRPA